MTAAEMRILELFMKENRDGHQDIKAFIRDVEQRLCSKITAITVRCNEREDEVSHLLAEREAAVDKRLAEREAAVDAKVIEAKTLAKNEMMSAIAAVTKPSVYRLATKGLFDGLGRFAARAIVVVALISGLIAMLDRFGVL